MKLLNTILCTALIFSMSAAVAKQDPQVVYTFNLSAQDKNVLFWGFNAPVPAAPQVSYMWYKLALTAKNAATDYTIPNVTIADHATQQTLCNFDLHMGGNNITHLSNLKCHGGVMLHLVDQGNQQYTIETNLN